MLYVVFHSVNRRRHERQGHFALAELPPRVNRSILIAPCGLHLCLQSAGSRSDSVIEAFNFRPER